MFHNDQHFLSYFHGFELSSPNNGRVTRFDLRDSATTIITSGFYVYGKETTDGVTSDVSYYFKVNTGTVQFYNIAVTRTGPWANLQPKKGLPSSVTDNRAAVQCGTALATKIRMPGLDSWIKSAGNIKIFSAELLIKPDLGTTFTPPDYLRISSQESYLSDVPNASIVYNDANILLLQKADPSINLSRDGAKQYSASRVFSYNSTANEYRCNITTHIQDVVDGSITQGHFNLYASDISTSLRQMLITKSPDKQNLKLRVYYYKI